MVARCAPPASCQLALWRSLSGRQRMLHRILQWRMMGHIPVILQVSVSKLSDLVGDVLMGPLHIVSRLGWRWLSLCVRRSWMRPGSAFSPRTSFRVPHRWCEQSDHNLGCRAFLRVRELPALGCCFGASEWCATSSIACFDPWQSRQLGCLLQVEVR